MARPRKVGLDYFPFECQSDERIRLIQAEYGLKGFAIVVKLLQKIYGEFGYYCEWDEERSLLFASENGSFSDDRNLIDGIVEACIRRFIFSKDMYDKYRILTSSEIQENYLLGTSRREHVELKKEYLLIKCTQKYKNVYINPVNVYKNSIVVNNNTQSKVKESKVNKNNIYSAKSADTQKTVKKSEGKNKDVVYYQDDELDKTFKDYIAFRKEIKAPMTDRAIELAKNKLNKLSGDNTSKAIEIINQSIMNSYKGLFEVKASNSEYRQYKQLQSNNRFNNFEQREEKDEDLDGLISKKMNERLKGRRG